MRIVILSDAYLPESTLIHAKMLHELAVEYVRRGHEVIVLTPGLCDQKNLVNRCSLEGVDVWRFRCRPTRGVSHRDRAINETLISWFAFRAIKRAGLNPNFDLCVNYSPTIFFGPLARWFRRRGAFVYLVLRDFFPQWVIDEGIIKENSLVANYFQFFENLNYASSNVVAVQSPANVPVFDKITGSRRYSVEVLYNWAAPASDVDVSFGERFIIDHRLGTKFLFFYGGNIGHAQDIPVILRLAKSIATQPDAHFLIIGQGDQYLNIKEKIKEMALSNVTLAPSVSQEEYRSLLTQVDCGVFTLAASHRAHNFPGKILGYLAAGLPILGSVNAGNDLIELVNTSGAGLVSVNGDFNNLEQDARGIVSSSETRRGMSDAATNLLQQVFCVTSAADQILERYKTKDFDE
jgi:glycosyltransferase involved in cell wall biosynthesis